MARYYVRPATGSNLNGGLSVGDAWETLEYAAQQATMGDIIDYDGTSTVSNRIDFVVGVSLEGASKTTSIIIGNDSSNFTLGFESDSQNTFGNQHITNIKLDGDSLTGYGGILVGHRGHVEVSDCHLVDFDYYGVSFRNGEPPSVYAKNNIFSGNTVTNCSGYHGGAQGCLEIQGQETMLIHHNYLDADRGGLNSGNCIYAVEGFIKDIKIYSNTFTKNFYDGVSSWDFALEFWNCMGGIEIYDNDIIGSIDLTRVNPKGIYEYCVWVHDNRIGQPTLPTHEGIRGVLLEYQANDVIIERNIISNVTQGIYFQQANLVHRVENIRIDSNLFLNIGSEVNKGWGIYFSVEDRNDIVNNIQIWNNIFIASQDVTTTYGIGLPDIGTATNISIRNNIVQGFGGAAVYGSGTGGVTITGVSIENNLFNDNGVNDLVTVNDLSTFSGWVVQNNITNDPLFVGGSDYSLQATSPARGAGLNVGLALDLARNVWNVTPSIGAYEYGSIGGSSVTNILISSNAGIIITEDFEDYEEGLLVGQGIWTSGLVSGDGDGIEVISDSLLGNIIGLTTGTWGYVIPTLSNFIPSSGFDLSIEVAKIDSGAQYASTTIGNSELNFTSGYLFFYIVTEGGYGELENDTPLEDGDIVTVQRRGLNITMYRNGVIDTDWYDYDDGSGDLTGANGEFTLKSPLILLGGTDIFFTLYWTNARYNNITIHYNIELYETNTITTDDGTIQFTAIVLPTNATIKTVTWSVINGTGTAAISSGGLLTALTDGTVTVKATANDDSGAYETVEVIISNQLVNAAKRLVPVGWHIPTKAEFDTIAAELGGTNVAGGSLKEAGTTHWTTPNTGATNATGFTALPAGYRQAVGVFASQDYIARYWTSDEYDLTDAYAGELLYDDALFSVYNVNKHQGLAIRPVKDDSINPGTTTDIDGNVYPTIQIGNIVIFAEDLRVTRFTDGTPIPNITDDTAWSNLTESAMCFYDNAFILPDTGGGGSPAMTEGSLYYGTVDPTGTLRLNYDGYFYATKLFSGGVEVGTGGETYTFIDSIVDESGGVHLVNDEDDPGPGMYYGTDENGVKGWNESTTLRSFNIPLADINQLNIALGRANFVNTIGYTIYLDFGNTPTGEGFFTFPLPIDYVDETDAIVNVMYIVDEAYSANNGEVRFALVFESTNGTISTIGGATTITGDDQNINVDAQKLNIYSFTLTGTYWDNQTVVGCYLQRIALTSGNNPTAHVLLLGAQVLYTAAHRFYY